jgi:hypothetical protein
MGDSKLNNQSAICQINRRFNCLSAFVILVVQLSPVLPGDRYYVAMVYYACCCIVIDNVR